MNATFIIIGMALVVAAVLVTGITLMVRGGSANRKYSNKLMTLRVILQAATLAVLALVVMAKKN